MVLMLSRLSNCNLLVNIPKSTNEIRCRTLWGWLNSVFNRVDEDRRKLVGPDRSCAEWLLRCGASVKWKDFDHWQKDYNTLPGGNFQLYKIEEIDATDSAVMAIGFSHLKGLNHVKKIKLHNCGYLDDSALTFLPFLKDTLLFLQLSSCGDISNQGLKPISELKCLKELKMFDLPEVKNMQDVINVLRDDLPQCNIQYIPEAKKQ